MGGSFARPVIVVTPNSLPAGNVGTPYGAAFLATGGDGFYSYKILSASPNTGGWIPVGINLTGGAFTGTPTTAETETLIVQATDSQGLIGTMTYSIAVAGGGVVATVYHGQAISIVAPGTGTKDHSNTIVFDQGYAPLGTIDPQWAAAGGRLGFISGGAYTGADAQYNPMNVLSGTQLSGTVIPTPHIYSRSFARGCLAYNPPGSGANEPTFTAQIGHTGRVYPKYTYIYFKYRLDQKWTFGQPDGDNNWKFITFTDGNLLCFSSGARGACYYYCGSGSGNGVFSGTTGVGWQCAFDVASPALTPTNLVIAPDINGHSYEWPQNGGPGGGGSPNADPRNQYASQYNPVNPANGWVITEYRIKWALDNTGYIKVNSSIYGAQFPPKLCVNYCDQTANLDPGNANVWNEGWACTYTRNYGFVSPGTPLYNQLLYYADHIYDQDGSNTFQMYLHDQPTLAASSWWEPQYYTGVSSDLWNLIVNVSTVPVGTAYFSAVNDAGTEISSQKVTVVPPPPDFPLMGAYLIGGTVDFVNVANVAICQHIVLSNYPGYSAGGKSLQQQAAALKALSPQIPWINPANMKLASYQMIMEVVPGAAQYATINTASNLNKWYLYTSYPAGSIVTTSGANALNIESPNLSASGTSPGGSGLTYRQWSALYNTSFSTGIAPSLDGIYTDNFNTSPAVAGDYLQNGSTSGTNASWQSAYVDWNTQIRASMGSSFPLHLGNLATWNTNNSFTPYNQLLNGGIMESIIGQSYSWEHTSWAFMMGSYAKCMQYALPVNGLTYVTFSMETTAATNYAAIRYGLCSCLMDNAYFFCDIASAGNQSYNNIAYLDEMAFNLGQATAGPNNPANGTYSSGGLVAWKQGVYRRDFQNGIVLINPRGNGSQTLTLETTYYTLRGIQDTTLNNHSAVTSVTLADPNVAGTGGSGQFLSRTPT